MEAIFDPAAVLMDGRFSFLYRWWWPTSPIKSELAERTLLGEIGRDYKLGWIKLDKERAINTLYIPAKNQKSVILIAHGFGSGIGFFFKTYPHLLQLVDEGTTVIAIDWLGMGRSSRVRIKGETLAEVEDYFIDSLEEWRIKMKFEKMTIMGHSLGGYLATCYAIKYPNVLDKLILVSPAGFPERPVVLRQYPWYFRVLFVLWENSFTPQGIVRSLGPLGPRSLNNYTTRKFGHLDKEDLANLRDYLYHISADTGAGEYAISHIFLPGAFAKSPLALRFHQVTVPTRFICILLTNSDGTADWMDKEGAIAAIRNHKNPEMHKIFTSEGGHHLYLDNYVAFNELFESILRE